MSWRTWSRSPAIRARQEVTPEGHCVFCQCPTGASEARQRYVCLKAACQTAYNTAYQRWRRLEKAQQGLTQRGVERKSSNFRWAHFYKEEL